LGFGWRGVANGLQKPSMVEPVDPFQGGEFNRFEAVPRSAPVDYLGLVKAVDRFGESVVIGIANGADGRLNACLRQPLGILDRHVLHAAIRIVDQPAAMDGPPIMKRLVESIEHESNVNEALP